MLSSLAVAVGLVRKATKKTAMLNCYNALKTQKEVATHFCVGVATVRRWHKAGCPRINVGSDKVTGARPRYDLAAVRAWLENRTQKGGEA